MKKRIFGILGLGISLFLHQSKASACNSDLEFVGAVYNNDIAKVAVCVQHQGVNLRTAKGLTPLMIAANSHYSEMLNLLLD